MLTQSKDNKAVDFIFLSQNYILEFTFDHCL
jgi:hypothetical protein